MTDYLPAVPPLPSVANPYDDWRARQKLAEKAIALNKVNVIEALKLSGITEVIIAFDGSGDDGGIESISCDGAKPIPDLAINEWVIGDEHSLVGAEAKLETAIENFAYALLEHSQAGWENGAGAFGEITIDVSAGTAVHTHKHDWLDATKETFADFRHRALRHHSQGIFEAERVFGRTIVNADGRTVPVRTIAEQHVKEDCGGRIPSVSDWLSQIRPSAWMSRGYPPNSGLALTGIDEATSTSMALPASRSPPGS